MKRIYYLVLAIVILTASYCSAADPVRHGPNQTTIIVGRSHYVNPYYTPNQNYEPIYNGVGEMVYNDFCTPDAKLCKPPRPLSDIIVKEKTSWVSIIIKLLETE